MVIFGVFVGQNDSVRAIFEDPNVLPVSASAPLRPKLEMLEGPSRIIEIGDVEKENQNYKMDVKWFYNGEFGKKANVGALAVNSENEYSKEKAFPSSFHNRIQPGVRSQRLLVMRNGDHVNPIQGDYETQKVIVFINFPETDKTIRKVVDRPILWEVVDPDRVDVTSTEGIDAGYARAVALIDSGNDYAFDKAKKILDQIILHDPKYVPAYPELARYYMKKNWRNGGLAQAEQMLDTALGIDPEHANSHVLIGHVYTHQKKYGQALTSFKKAEEIGTNNLWLYANWGHLFLQLDNIDAAIEKYELAIKPPRGYDTYDRARLEAYRKLIRLLQLNNDDKKVSKIFAKRIKEFPNDGCHVAEYAEYELTALGRYDDAIKMIESSMNRKCQYESYRKKVLGLAYFSKWAHEFDPDKGQELYTKGQILYGDLPAMLTDAAESEKTAKILAQFVKKGLSIDSLNADGVTALVLSMGKSGTTAAKTILESGADPNKTIGDDGWTAIMVAAYSGRADLIKVLLEHGADPGIESTSGKTALSIAKANGYDGMAKIIRVYTEKSI